MYGVRSIVVLDTPLIASTVRDETVGCERKLVSLFGEASAGNGTCFQERILDV